MSKIKEFLNEIDYLVRDIWLRIGIDKPANHDEIVKFVAEDVLTVADPVHWTSGDIDIAFRRWIEKDCDC